jgi:cation:H+ antiporter
MGTDVPLLVAGLVLLIGGGDALVRGAAALARSFGISPLVVGLTVVAFGTSAPELAVNVSAALRDSGELSFGNIVGSNIANIGLVIGLTALVRPVAMHLAVITREIPMMALASLVAVAMVLDVGLGGTAVDQFARSDGVILLLLFGVFVYYTVNDAVRQRGHPLADDEMELAGRPKTRAISLLLTLVGFAGLIIGGKLTVDGAIGVARVMGISEAVIGMTIVAVGTSLPELVTSLVSVLRKQTDLAVGNVIGSNIFNLLFVLGITAILRPVPVPKGGHTDLYVATGLAMLLLPLSINPTRHVARWGGLLLFSTYAGYLAWRSLSGSG